MFCFIHKYEFQIWKNLEESGTNQPEENLEGSNYYLSSAKIQGSFQLSPHLWSFSFIIAPHVDSAVISFFYFPPIT